MLGIFGEHTHMHGQCHSKLIPIFKQKVYVDHHTVEQKNKMQNIE